MQIRQRQRQKVEAATKFQALYRMHLATLNIQRRKAIARVEDERLAAEALEAEAKKQQCCTLLLKKIVTSEDLQTRILNDRIKQYMDNLKADYRRRDDLTVMVISLEKMVTTKHPYEHSQDVSTFMQENKRMMKTYLDNGVTRDNVTFIEKLKAVYYRSPTRIMLQVSQSPDDITAIYNKLLNEVRIWIESCMSMYIAQEILAKKGKKFYYLKKAFMTLSQHHIIRDSRGIGGGGRG